MTRICFDYDTVCYQVGFAAEERSILVTHKNTKDMFKFANRSEFYGRDRARSGGWLAVFNEGRDSPHSPDEYDIEDVQVMRPFKLVDDILNTKINSVCKHLGSKDYYGWYGQGKVFRHDVATILEYKGGARKNALKPLALNYIKEALLERHHAKVATDMLEADDWLAIDSYTAWGDWIKTKSMKDRLIVITPDKDARQCSGSHLFNPDEMRLPMTINGFGDLYWKETNSGKKLSGHGRKWLYIQCLLGDSTDNYMPSELHKDRFGEVSAFDLFYKCKSDKEALTILVNQYKTWFPEDVKYTSWDGKPIQKDWLGIAEEMWELARMKRWVGDDATLRSALENLGVNY